VEQIMAGYSGTPLIKKLGIKPGYSVHFMKSPEGFLEYLGPLPDDVIVAKRLVKALDLILLFEKSEANLKKSFGIAADKLNPNGMLWVAWPKKSSGVATDLYFDVVQRIGLQAGLVDVKICAVDDIWSGLKFVYRLADRAGRINR
jgi:hypothetical protein